jgi:uncharacterized protein YndB with AHSA1/START domain
MRKKVLYVLAALVAIVAIAGLVGLFIPKQHEAWRLMTFRATPDKVFAVVSDFAKYAEWRTGVTRIDVTPAGGGVGAVVTEHGPDGPMPYRIELIQPLSKIVTRIADPDLPFGGTWTYEITPNDSGSDLVITENGEIYNPFFRLLGKIFFSPTDTIDAYMADLKRRLGE